MVYKNIDQMFFRSKYMPANGKKAIDKNMLS